MRCTPNVLLLYFVLLASCANNPFPQGKNLYDSYCVNCHMEDGEGLERLMPPLNNSDYLKEKPARVVCMIRHGNDGTVIVNGTKYSGLMPANPDLSPTQITNIMNYINNAWDNNNGFTQPDSVRKWLNDCNTE